MTSLHYDPYSRRSAGYPLAPPNNYSANYHSRSRMHPGSSVISGIKSMFCSKKAAPSVTSARVTPYFEGSAVESSNLSCSRYSIDAYTPTVDVPKREVARIKSSDSFPVVPPQLEDRMLQLADRSRRLGVHRFSRTRNSLILNQHTPVHSSNSSVTMPAVKSNSSRSQSWVSTSSSLSANRFARGGSTTSVSTQSSTPFGCETKIALPHLYHPGVRTSVRE
jgi:hypothetical protein